MIKEAILHIPDSQYAFTLDEQTMVIRIRTKREDIKCCTLCYGDRVCRADPIEITKVVMKKIATDKLFDYFECEFISPYSRVCYYFELNDGKERTYLFGDDFSDQPSLDRTAYYQFAYLHRADVAAVPNWAKEAVIYQIFPDSFANGYRKIQQGNLKGIIENLDYMKELGITCLYLNPIFRATSYHKYDTIDYFQIDPDFGTAEDLKELVNICHKNNIRVILDGVFNHCGSEFPAFLDLLKKQQASNYVDWFYKLAFPVKYQTPPNYEAFAYVKEMPKMNTMNPQVQDYFCRVGEYWIEEADIDGWRLDVANEINHDFWRMFRKRIKAIKEEAILIGEIWEDAGQWLLGDQFDSTMNYRFSNECKAFFADHTINAYEFSEKVSTMLMRYKRPMSYIQMNLLDSHDVPRFLTKCQGKLDNYKLAVMFLLTFVGMPSIFYGDELLIEGNTEREYRKPMPWEKEKDNGLYDYFKELITIRKTHQALTTGCIKLCPISEEVLGYLRYQEEEKLLILINNSDKEKRVDFQFRGRKYQGTILYSETFIKPEKFEYIIMRPMQGIIITLD